MIREYKPFYRIVRDDNGDEVRRYPVRCMCGYEIAADITDMMRAQYGAKYMRPGDGVVVLECPDGHRVAYVKRNLVEAEG